MMVKYHCRTGYAQTAPRTTAPRRKYPDELHFVDSSDSEDEGAMNDGLLTEHAQREAVRDADANLVRQRVQQRFPLATDECLGILRQKWGPHDYRSKWASYRALFKSSMHLLKHQLDGYNAIMSAILADTDEETPDLDLRSSIVCDPYMDVGSERTTQSWRK